jgi:hypothetical protein
VSGETPRNARQEAFDRLGGRYEVRVLEPSPPAEEQPPFGADPTARGDVPPGRQVVSPVSTGDLRWEDLVAEDPGLADWAADRRLAAHRRIGPPPPLFAETREGLHRLAEHVMSPTRQRDRGEITLRWTLGGFGTPFFGNDAQLRVEGDCFVVQLRDRVQRGRLTTLKDAAEFVGFDLTRSDEAIEQEPLSVDAEASRYLGEVYGLAFSVLEELRASAGAAYEPSLVNLWPEHFDVAVELGRDADGRRAALGVSPGDADHPDPYIYVAPWSARVDDTAIWNATAFRGAELPWADIVAAGDQRELALGFLRDRLAALHGV